MDAHSRGVHLSLLCLLLLGALPVIAGARPGGSGALGFAALLSSWQLVFAAPLYVAQRRGRSGGGPGMRTVGWRAVLPAWVQLALTGSLFALATLAYVVGVDRAGPIDFAIAAQAYPVFAVALEVLAFRRRKSAAELALMGVIAATMIHLGTGGTWRVELASSGFLVALSVPLLWSIAHVAVKRLLDAGAATPADVVFTRVLISTVLLGAAWAEADGTARLLQAIGDRKLQAAAALMGGLYYLELLSWFHAVKHVDVSTAASITAPSPVVTTIIAVSVLGQPIGSHQVAALAIVVMCVWGLIRASRPRRA